MDSSIPSRCFANPVRACITLFLLAFAVNLTAMFAMHRAATPERLEADESEYYGLAGDMLHGDYEFNSRRVVGHVLILAGARWLSCDNMLALQTIITLMFSFTAPLAYLVARRFSANDARPTSLTAVIAGLAVAVWPPLVAYGVTLYSETTALPVFLAFLATLPRGGRLGGVPAPARRWILSGALLGLCMLIRPMYLLFTPFVLLILWAEADRFRVVFAPILLLAIGCAAALSPWSIYGSIKLGEPMLLSTNGGETLAGGLNPALLRNGYVYQVLANERQTWVGPGKWISDAETGYLDKNELKLSHAQRSRLLHERTMQWIAVHPWDAFRLEAAKLAYMWGVYPFWNGFKQTLFGNIPILVLVLTGLWTLVRFRSRFRSLAMLWCMPLFVSGVALISWGSWRFRQPADVALLILTSLLIGSLLKLSPVGKSGVGDPRRFCYT
jgi:hypothetical protein